MSAVIESKKSKDRSPTFPFISLERAIERAREFYAEEKRGVAPYTRAVLHWDYSEASSGALQTVSALKAYGLLVEQGGTGLSRQLRVSDLALRILLDQRPESQERLDFIRQAARAPAVAAAVYANWHGRLPSDSTLNHYLVLEKKFNEATARTAIKILKENQVFAELDESCVPSEADEMDEESSMQSARQMSALGRGDAPPVTPQRPAVAAALVAQHVRAPQLHTEQHLLRNGVTITVSFSALPTADTYHALARIMKFKGDDFDEQEAPPAGAIPATGQ